MTQGYWSERLIITRKRVPGLSDASLSRFLRRAGEKAGLSGRVNVLLTTSKELRALNSRFRHKDKATDVLSFPASQELEGKLAGDVAISVEIASRNARQLGHTAADEVKILTLHGVLHLAGYDHETDSGEMARTEQRLRRAFRLPTGLIERNGAADTKMPRTERDPRGTGRRKVR